MQHVDFYMQRNKVCLPSENKKKTNIFLAFTKCIANAWRWRQLYFVFSSFFFFFDKKTRNLQKKKKKENNKCINAENETK